MVLPWTKLVSGGFALSETGFKWSCLGRSWFRVVLIYEILVLGGLGLDEAGLGWFCFARYWFNVVLS